MVNMSVIGHVYFIYIPSTYKQYNHIKIGSTKNLKKRLGQLQTGNAHELSIYKNITSPDYKKIERDLHKKYASKRVLNEWFNITTYEVDKIMNEYEPIPANNYTLTGVINYLYSWVSYFKR